jgi:hypothetical protein
MQTRLYVAFGCFNASTGHGKGSLEVVCPSDEGQWRALLPLQAVGRLRVPIRSNFEFSKNLQRAVNEKASIRTKTHC